MSNIAAGTERNIKDLIDNGFFPLICQIFRNEKKDIRIEATWTLCNFSQIKNKSYIEKLLNDKTTLDGIIKRAFDSVDINNDHSIDETELEKIMVQITSDMGAEPPTKEDVKEVMEALDTDRSNSIDQEEFGQLIKNILKALIE